MLAKGVGLLAAAHSNGRALAAMTTYSLESTRAVCTAAEEVGLAVILQAGSSSFGAVGRELLAASALSAARDASVPVGVHLDHSTDVDEIRSCIALGYTSVMVDGSQLKFEANIALTRAVVDEAHAAGVWVEGELGPISGDEDSSTDAVAARLTDPDQAAEFVLRTGVDALAVAIGNVHGCTTTPVRLDLARLQAIATLTPVPLVLHGASGLSDEDLSNAVRVGVAKVNINAELRRAYLAALRAGLAQNDDDIRRLQELAIKAMIVVAKAKILLLAGGAELRR
jgi:ketose-bisphosphate aldolase